MKNFTNPEHFAFTNHFGGPHFNQSLLKNRITMMNKTRSTWKTMGKYALFMVAMVGVLAAVKPTQKQPTVGTKYLLRTENAIEWVITPKTTMADLSKIQEELEKDSLKFDVLEFKLDPLQSFIVQLQILSSSGFSISRSISPIGSDFNKIDLKTKKSYTKYYPIGYKPSSTLLKIAEEDSIAAQKAYLANAMQYEIGQLREEYNGNFGNKAQYLSVRSFPKPMPDFYIMSLTQSLVLRDNVSPREILKVASELHRKKAVFRVDNWPTRYEQIAKIDPQNLKELFTVNVYDRRNNYAQKTFVFIHTLSQYP
jgi:hypothetical protein